MEDPSPSALADCGPSGLSTSFIPLQDPIAIDDHAANLTSNSIPGDKDDSQRDEFEEGDNGTPPATSSLPARPDMIIAGSTHNYQHSNPFVSSAARTLDIPDEQNSQDHTSAVAIHTSTPTSDKQRSETEPVSSDLNDHGDKKEKHHEPTPPEPPSAYALLSMSPAEIAEMLASLPPEQRKDLAASLPIPIPAISAIDSAKNSKRYRNSTERKRYASEDQASISSSSMGYETSPGNRVVRKNVRIIDHTTKPTLATISLRQEQQRQQHLLSHRQQPQKQRHYQGGRLATIQSLNGQQVIPSLTSLSIHPKPHQEQQNQHYNFTTIQASQRKQQQQKLQPQQSSQSQPLRRSQPPIRPLLPPTTTIPPPDLAVQRDTWKLLDESQKAIKTTKRVFSNLSFRAMNPPAKSTNNPSTVGGFITPIRIASALPATSTLPYSPSTLPPLAPNTSSDTSSVSSSTSSFYTEIDPEENSGTNYMLGDVMIPPVDYKGLRKSTIPTWVFTCILLPLWLLHISTIHYFNSFFSIKPFNPMEEIHLASNFTVYSPASNNSAMYPLVSADFGFSRVCITDLPLPSALNEELEPLTRCLPVHDYCEARISWILSTPSPSSPFNTTNSTMPSSSATSKLGLSESVSRSNSIQSACQAIRVTQGMMITASVFGLFGWWGMWFIFAGRWKRLCGSARRHQYHKRSGRKLPIAPQGSNVVGPTITSLDQVDKESGLDVLSNESEVEKGGGRRNDGCGNRNRRRTLCGIYAPGEKRMFGLMFGLAVSRGKEFSELFHELFEK
jgi:hypothetical protein